MSRKKRCFDCNADITHKNYVSLVNSGAVVKVCVDCAKKRANTINRCYVNRMCDSGVQ